MYSDGCSALGNSEEEKGLFFYQWGVVNTKEKKKKTSMTESEGNRKEILSSPMIKLHSIYLFVLQPFHVMR